MNKHIIIMYSDYGKTVAKRILFNGSCREDRIETNRILYSDDKYVSFDVEISI